MTAREKKKAVLDWVYEETLFEGRGEKKRFCEKERDDIC